MRGVTSTSRVELGLLGVACVLDGVPATPPLCFLDGVAAVVPSSNRSNRPRTCPSRCGVGPKEVFAEGVKSFLDIVGVSSVLWSWNRLFEGVSMCFARFSGVSDGVGASGDFRLCCRLDSLGGGAVFPLKMSWAFWKSLYLLAISH